MFITFLNKEDYHFLDLSVFINCKPEKIMFYYYNSQIKISLDTYLQMKEWAQSDDTAKSCLNLWLNLIEKQLDTRDDLLILQESEYLNTIGPYYYGPTNTQFYFSKFNKLNNEPLTSVDFGVLFNLHKSPPIDRNLQKYFKLRKNNKKTTQGREDLLHDLGMCLDALNQISKVNRHCHYHNLLLNARRELLNQEEILPQPPESMPAKPEKPEAPQLSFSSLLALNISKNKQKEYEKTCSDYNRRLKIYLIKYREYEKTCERYKNALQSWEEEYLQMIEACVASIEESEAKLKTARGLLDMYQFILDKSFIHSNYHNIDSLATFKHYLDTGRADDLQDCMNLYEEERHWREIKASQERIETTIHFLQAESEPMLALNQQVTKLIAGTMDGQI